MSAGLLIGAYLLGSVPFSYLLVRLFLGRDIRAVGSGNPGATNVMRAGGKWAGLAALALDLGKGVAPVLVGRALGADTTVIAGAAAAAVCGHVFPIFLGFRGGKGVATAAGALGALAPLSAGLAAAVFVIAVAATRYVSLGSILGIAGFPALYALSGTIGWQAGYSPRVVWIALVLAALVTWRHRANLARLWNGTESKLGERA